MPKIKTLLYLLFFIAIDQLSKYIIRTSGGFYTCNKGVAFGININLFLLSFLLFILLFIMLFFLIRRNDLKSTVSNLDKNSVQVENYQAQLIKIFPLILILSGGISNLFDRLYFGCVIDFINLKFWPVFNLADIYITIGSIIIMLKMISKK